MGVWNSFKAQKARKKYWCVGCRKEINKGDWYIRHNQALTRGYKHVGYHGSISETLCLLCGMVEREYQGRWGRYVIDNWIYIDDELRWKVQEKFNNLSVDDKSRIVKILHD